MIRGVILQELKKIYRLEQQRKTRLNPIQLKQRNINKEKISILKKMLINTIYNVTGPAGN